jgi:hypothetical protein
MFVLGDAEQSAIEARIICSAGSVPVVLDQPRHRNASPGGIRYRKFAAPDEAKDLMLVADKVDHHNRHRQFTNVRFARPTAGRSISLIMRKLATAAFASMQSNDTVDGVQFGWLD